MAEWIYDASTQAGQFKVVGEMTVGQVAGLKDELLQAIEQTADLVVDISRVTAIDIAGLQLLVSSWKLASQRNGRLSLVTGDNQPFAHLVKQAGMTRPLEGLFGDLS